MGMSGKQMFDFFVSKGMTKAGAAGLMGNLIAESGLEPTNLQNNYERSLGLNDAQYTAAVDNGTYQNFVRDAAGYGLAQWTYWSRKQALLDFKNARGASIGDAQMQLDFLMQELEKSYPTVLAVLKTATSIRTASDIVLLQFERPADQDEPVRQSRAALGQGVFNSCSGAANPAPTAAAQPVAPRTVSPLATQHVDFGTQKSNARTEKITKITIHHMAGISDGVACARGHLYSTRQASANYYIGNDGSICSGVPENRRAWTSDSPWNDQRAITIEVSNNRIGNPNGMDGWTVSDAAYKATIALCADICKHYGITPHFDGTQNGSLTVHHIFAATACPGAQLNTAIRSGKVEKDIIAAMGGQTTQTADVIPFTENDIPAVPFLARVKITDLLIREQPSRTAQKRGYCPKGTYTITEVKNGYGRLKSGLGWIYVIEPAYVDILK